MNIECNSSLNSRAILKQLISENKAHLLCKIKCQKCGNETQVLDKPYKENY